MNRLFKCFLCFLLTACMVLPLLPASAQAASEEEFNYYFGQPVGVEAEGVKAITKDNYTTFTYGGTPLNWYYLEDSFKGDRIAKFDSTAMMILDTVGAHWIALVIVVPKSGYYDIDMQIKLAPSCGVGNIYIIPATEENKTGLAASDGIDVNNAVVKAATPIATIDYYGYKAQVNHTANRELQSMYLNAGEHILIFQGAEKGRGGTSYMTPMKLTLTKQHVIASNAETLMNEMVSGNGQVNLGADMQVSALMIPDGVTIDLNGHKLTCDSFFATAKASLIDSSGGKGVLVVNDPIFSSMEEYIPLYDAKVSGYRLFHYEVQTSQTRAGDYGRKFSVTLDFDNDDAYDVLASGTSGLEIDLQLKWSDKQTPLTYTTKGATESAIKQMGKTEDPLTIQITNLDKLSAQIISVTPTLRIRGQSYTCVAIICPIIK